jgi:hypothetical protein
MGSSLQPQLQSPPPGAPIGGVPDLSGGSLTPPGTQGGPVYRELMRIFQGGLAERRAGRDADAFVRQNAGEGSDIQSMRDIADALANGLHPSEYPMTGSERLGGEALEAAKGLTLGVPTSKSPLVPKALTWPEAVRAHVQQYEANKPLEAAGINRVAAFPTYAAAAASGNPWVAAAGAGASTGVEAAASLPEGPIDWKKVMAVGGPALVSAFLTRGLAAGAHGLAGKFVPEAEGAEQLVELSGGHPALEKEAARMRAETPGVEPRLAELNPRLGKAATRGVPLQAPEIQQDLINSAHDAWLEARNAKLAVGQKYSALNVPIQDARVDAVLRKPALGPLLSQLKETGVLTEKQVPGFGGLPEGEVPEPLTGRTVNDVRLELESNLKKIGRQIARDPQRTDLIKSRGQLRDASQSLRQVLVDNVDGFEDLQKEYGPYAQREATRREMFKRLAGVDPSPAGPPKGLLPPGRGTGLPKPPETSVKGQLAYHTMVGGVRGTTEQQTIAQARRLGPLLWSHAGDALDKIKSGTLWPWYAGEGSVTAAGVRAVPGVATGGAASFGLPKLLKDSTEDTP